MNKMQLEILIKLPKSNFDAVIKLLNNKVTNNDLKPMFPEGWSDNCNWPLEYEESNAERWKKWEPYQLQIDAELERQMGC